MGIRGFLAAVCVILAPGCAQQTPRAPTLVSPYARQVIFALAPVLNYSGTSNLDPLKVSDILYSELQQVPGISVVPLNRTMAAMAGANLPSITTQQQAAALAEALNVDGLIVAAITEYNPYYPPVVGMALELYTRRRQGSQGGGDNPFALSTRVERIFNSRDRHTAEKVEHFANQRGCGGSPYGWQVYLRSQEYYLRFVAYELFKQMLQDQQSVLAAGNDVSQPASLDHLPSPDLDDAGRAGPSVEDDRVAAGVRPGANP